MSLTFSDGVAVGLVEDDPPAEVTLSVLDRSAMIVWDDPVMTVSLPAPE